jgi:hypothetical protein
MRPTPVMTLADARAAGAVGGGDTKRGAGVDQEVATRAIFPARYVARGHPATAGAAGFKRDGLRITSALPANSADLGSIVVKRHGPWCIWLD